MKNIKQPKMKLRLLITLLITVFFHSCRNGKQEIEPQKPNIVYILADDLGYGDLSCNGQELFSTPNIDKLAESGLKFTQHYSGSTVCAPSRSSLMTGQHTGHTFIRGNKGWPPEGQYPLEAEAYTLAEALQNAGYVTGAFGKWGLGYPGSEGDPNNQGFDEFFGYNCQGLAHNYYPGHLWDNQKKVILEENSGDNFAIYAPELIHQRALQFLEKNRDKPFFMFYPNVIPHAELLLPEENLAEFRGKFLPEKEFKGAEPGDPGFRESPYGTQPESHAAFVAMVTLLDRQVGEVVSKLKELGIYENTIIMFTSDNGPHMEGGADPDYFNSNGPLKGYKRDLYEGGIRVPMIAVWEGKIAPQTETDHPSAFWDVFPTFAEITGAKTPDNIDGISFLPTLLGKADEQDKHDYLYWEFHERDGRKALRKGDWKLINYNVFDPAKTTVELYNIATDPGEENNVAEAHPEIVEELEKLMKSARTESKIFTFESKTYLE
jgi:arylsulfatase A-like enzyme